MNIEERKNNYCTNICKAWCCRNIVVTFDSFTGNLQDDDLFFSLRGCKLNKLTNDLIVPLKCRWLTNHNKCKMYPYRPQGCREYECDKLKSYVKGLKL